MKERLLKKEAQKLMQMPGNVRGGVILANLEFIRQKAGQSEMGKIQEKLKGLGIAFNLKELKPMEFYPEALSVLTVLLVKEILNLDDNGVFEMGKAGIKLSLFIKILTKYFVSPRQCFEESPGYWQKHFDFGELEPIELNEGGKYAIIRIKGYKYHPIMCFYHRGCFLQVAELILGRSGASIEETKCAHKKDPYHEYIIRWK